jgi:hypothetical protein
VNQQAEIVAKIQKAASFQEQAALVAQLDALQRNNREATAAARSIDMADTVIRQTLQPVAVHERSTLATDWMAELSTTASDASQKVTVEASMWYNRVSPEVKANSEEFAEQARGMARRTASAYGEQANALAQEFFQYVSFLRSKEAASGLPQVQQTVDAFENKAPTALPTDVFDNFAPPVAPINEGATGTESSERAPLIDAAMAEAGAPAGVETHHDTEPQPYTYAEVPPGQDMRTQSAWYQPSVGISHVATLDDFRNKTGIFAEGAFGQYDREDKMWPEHCNQCGLAGGYERPGVPCADCDANTDRMGMCPNCYPMSERSPWERDHFKQITSEGARKQAGSKCKNCTNGNHTGTNGSADTKCTGGSCSCPCGSKRKEAASGLDQVQQTVDSFEDPDETALPTQVMFPWILGPDAGGQAENQTPPQQPQVNPNVVNRQMNTSQAAQKAAAFQRRAAYVAALATRDPRTLTEAERKEVMQFSAALRKRADAWTQIGNQYPGPDAANSPFTTPDSLNGTRDQGIAEGRSDWPNEAPDFADASPSIPPFAEGHAMGYEQAAHADPFPASPAGQLPPGAGGIDQGYQTHAGSRKVSSREDEGSFDHTPEGGWCPVCTGTGCSSNGVAQDAGGSTCPDCEGTGHRRQASRKEAIYHESFGEVSRPQLAAYRKHNVSPSDHMDMEDVFGESDGGSNSAAMTAHVKKHSPDGYYNPPFAWQYKMGSLRVSASFTSPMDEADPEFKKAYKFASKWQDGKRLVRQGSAAFEAGLYAGISDNPAQQSAWVQAHNRMAQKHGEFFTKRIAMHREFSKQASKNTGLKVQGAYLAGAGTVIDPNSNWDSKSQDEQAAIQEHTNRLDEQGRGEWDEGGVWKPAKHAKTAGTVMEMDTMSPSTSPSPTGQTPINGVGEPGPLAGDGQNPARPGGPSPYQGAEPFGQPAVPVAGTGTGTPTAISTLPGAPVDKAALEHISPQAAAFRKRVQANLLKSKVASRPFDRTAATVPVCKGCGETFDSRETAHEAHGKNGCGNREDGTSGYTMTPEDEAW